MLFARVWTTFTAFIQGCQHTILGDTQFHSQTAILAMNPPASAQNAALLEFQQSRQEMQMQARLHGGMHEPWFAARRALKRGPPSTPAASGRATPVAPTEMTVDGIGDGAQLFQPIAMDEDSSTQLTAAEHGVNINDPHAIQAWLAQPMSTRKDVLDTVRSYHKAVIRPELFNMISQVESVIQVLDDRLLQQHKELYWMASENRQQQKAACALMVLTTGWDPTMPPEDRLYMVNWMLSQVEVIRHFLQTRGHPLDGAHSFLNVLVQEPTTVPNPQGHSTLTTLSFKSWDTRQAFMSHFGGQAGTPLWRDEVTPVTGKHLRVAPASPQYQRKLELPLRVVLDVLNTSPEFKGQQVVILWKTLTIMQPQVRSSFDDQAEALCRLHYSEQDGTLKGVLEVTPELMDVMNTTPLNETETRWHSSWNKVVWGTQYELDQADKLAAEKKGVGKGKHWARPLIYSSYHSPYPLELAVSPVDQIAYVWDEYCDKTSATEKKIGTYQQATVKGRPAVAAAPKTPPPSLAAAVAKSSARA